MNLLEAMNILLAKYVLQVDELQVTIEDEQRSLLEEMKNISEEQKVGPEDTNGSAEAMNIDQDIIVL